MIVPALLLLLTVLAGCGGASVPPAPAASAETAPVPAVPATVDADEVPASARSAYLTGLERIDPGLVVNEDRAIRRATNICLDITQGKDEATIVDNTRQRLSGGNATIDNAQAAEAVTLARQHICAA